MDDLINFFFRVERALPSWVWQSSLDVARLPPRGGPSQHKATKYHEGIFLRISLNLVSIYL